jgi:MFS family permease
LRFPSRRFAFQIDGVKFRFPILKGLPRAVWMLGFVSLLTDINTEMSVVVLPLFLTVTLGAGVEFVGLVEGVAETTASLLKIFSGWLSDRLGKPKAITLAGYTLSTVTRPLLALAGSAAQVLGVRFLDRIGKGIRTSPRDALLAGTVEPARRGFVFGFHRAMDNTGAVLGPLIAFAILTSHPGDYRRIFWVAVLPALLTIPLLIWGVREQTGLAKAKETVPAPAGPFDREFRRYLVIVFGFTLANSSDAFLILRAKGLGVAEVQIPILYAALQVSKVLSNIPGGALSDRLSRKTLIIAGWLLYASVYFGLAAARAPIQVWALFIIYGLFFGMTEGTERAWVADLVPAEMRGRAYGAFHFAVGIGALPSSLLMGVLWKHFGAAAAFAYGAVLALISAMALAVLIPGRRTRANG